jgi:hypothetical protein
MTRWKADSLYSFLFVVQNWAVPRLRYSTSPVSCDGVCALLRSSIGQLWSRIFPFSGLLLVSYGGEYSLSLAFYWSVTVENIPFLWPSIGQLRWRVFPFSGLLLVSYGGEYSLSLAFYSSDVENTPFLWPSIGQNWGIFLWFGLLLVSYGGEPVMAKRTNFGTKSHVPWMFRECSLDV